MTRDSGFQWCRRRWRTGACRSRAFDGLRDCKAVGAPPAAIGDPAELLDVHVDQLAGPVALVADRGLLGGADHLTADPIEVTQPWHARTEKDPGHRAGRRPGLSGEPFRAAPQSQAAYRVIQVRRTCGRPHRRGDVRLSPPRLVPVDDQLSAKNSRAGISVRHENLRVDAGPRQATLHSGVLTRSSRPPSPTSWPGTSSRSPGRPTPSRS